MTKKREQDIEQLNSFLRGERSAVETYSQCIDEVEDAVIVSELIALRASHQLRVRLLSDEIRALGGEPAQESGLWGAFAQLVEGGAKIFGLASAISALEEGEDHGKADYDRDLARVSPDIQRFLATAIIPEQERTHNALSVLQEKVK
jgi:hypothetical protein